MNLMLCGKVLVCLDEAIMFARQAGLDDYVDEMEELYDRINSEYCENVEYQNETKREQDKKGV